MKFWLLLSLQFSLCTISYGWTGLAVDLVGSTTKDQVECLRVNNYTAIFSRYLIKLCENSKEYFIRVYYANTFDMDSLPTINNAAASNFLDRNFNHKEFSRNGFGTSLHTEYLIEGPSENSSHEPL